jgi:hypothetical protein
MFRIIATMMFCTALVILAGALGQLARADTPTPAPGCGFVSALPWDPCSANPPVPGQFWTPVDGIPGTMGPHGYTPITDH